MPRKAAVGSVYRRADGRWEARRQVDNVRISAYGDTRREALSRLQAKLDGEDAVASALTLGGWLDRWIDDWVSARASDRTVHLYRQAAQVWGRQIGRVELVDLGPAEVQAAITQLRRLYAPVSVKNYRVILSSALNDAVRAGLIPENPVRHTTAPKTPVVSPEVRETVAKLLAGGLARLLAATPGSSIDGLVELACGCGLRHAEILGLRWCDIGERHLSVRQQAVFAKGYQRVIRPPKTSSSVRDVPIPPFVRAALDRVAPARDPRFDLVFHYPDGSPMRRQTMQERLDRLARKVGIDYHIRVHDLRHVYGTELARHRVPPSIIKDLLGHADVRTTMAIYATPETDDELMIALVTETVDGLSSGPSLLPDGQHDTEVASEMASDAGGEAGSPHDYRSDEHGRHQHEDDPADAESHG